MPSVSRRLTVALLWLAIALLPARGWAATLMSLGASLQAVPAAAVLPPCHGDAQASDTHVVPLPADASHPCAMCDLCHATAAQAPAAPVLPPRLPDAVPHADGLAPIEPRAPDGLYRPPRALQA